MTDWFTDELFPTRDDRFISVRYPVSRLILDPERFEDDSQEVMASRGMGVVYSKTSSGDPLRGDLSEADRQALIDRYYRPHHERLSNAVREIRARFGSALVIDCHSFPSLPLPYELDQRVERPDICLGADKYHTPTWLTEVAMGLFSKEGLSVEVNRPFAGALVPLEYFGVDPSVSGLMIEVNRKLYMDEETGQRSEKFEETGVVIRKVCTRLSER